MDPVSAVVGTAITSIVNSMIKPKIEETFKNAGLAYDKYLIPKNEHFSEYLHRTYKKYSIINTLVSKNTQRELKDIYIPLTLKWMKDNNLEKIRIDSYPKDIINNLSFASDLSSQL